MVLEQRLGDDEVSTHVSLREVITVAQLSSPSLSERIEHEVSSIDVAVGLVTGHVACLHGDVGTVRVSPR